MPLVVTVNGRPPGHDRLLATAAGRRFPAIVSLTNTGASPVDVELRIREGAGARVVIENSRWTLGAGGTLETKLHAETPSQAEGDTVLEVLADGVLSAEFHFTAVSLLRESVFHNFLSGGR